MGLLDSLKELIAKADAPAVVPVVDDTPPVVPVAVTAPPPEPEPVPAPAVEGPPPEVATAAETIIPPPGVVTSAAPTGEALYMAMTQKDLADLATKNDPTLMALLRGPVTGIK